MHDTTLGHASLMKYFCCPPPLSSRHASLVKYYFYFIKTRVDAMDQVVMTKQNKRVELPRAMLEATNMLLGESFQGLPFRQIVSQLESRIVKKTFPDYRCAPFLCSSLKNVLKMLTPDIAAPKHVKFRQDVDAKYGDGSSGQMWDVLHELDERHNLVSCISIVKKAGDEIVQLCVVGTHIGEAVLAAADTDGTRAALQAVFAAYDESDKYVV